METRGEGKQNPGWKPPSAQGQWPQPRVAQLYLEEPQGTWQSHSQMSQRWNQRAQPDSLVTQAEILMQPRLRKAPRCAWLPQDEEHLPVMSRSLISMRPRRQIRRQEGLGVQRPSDWQALAGSPSSRKPGRQL